MDLGLAIVTAIMITPGPTRSEEARREVDRWCKDSWGGGTGMKSREECCERRQALSLRSFSASQEKHVGRSMGVINVQYIQYNILIRYNIIILMLMYYIY